MVPLFFHQIEVFRNKIVKLMLNAWIIYCVEINFRYFFYIFYFLINSSYMYIFCVQSNCNYRYMNLCSNKFQLFLYTLAKVLLCFNSFLYFILVSIISVTCMFPCVWNAVNTKKKHNPRRIILPNLLSNFIFLI